MTITNKSRSNLTITQASVAANGFKVTGISLPMTIGPGKQSMFDVVFSPKSSERVSGVISVFRKASHLPETISVSGSGAAATHFLNASTTKLSFGGVRIYSSSALKVTLDNAGNSDVSISRVSVSDPRFVASGVSAGLILAPGQHETLDVSFLPVAPGDLTGSVTVISNAANSPTIISLSGAGVQTVSHSVELTWAPDAAPVAGYNVHRSTVSGGPYTKLNPILDPAAAYTDHDVQNGQTYYYVVTSVSFQNRESVYSSQVSATIP